ncbi:MAG: radical SAM protein [Candidatus Obscuribacter phosphatis]|uniref:Radical SAM protein n=1 Tax=Candidatus Obscuribacter phosphatis TaxID=1906157 RepID=A0A8J7P9H6_9BACT|nr:radical SAM protein [Candidatus Obscuribacter phosphatis]
MTDKVQFYIDIVGSCNLRCPSCPKGNSSQVENKSGVMSLELLNEILVKAKSEYNVESINLYNWTEPFVHPKLPEAVRLVHSHGLACGISSNLSFAPRLQEVMAEKPEGFKVSLSGFNQSVYERSHSGGDIEKVKENIELLAKYWKENGQVGYIEVNFHRYLGNLDDELAMQKFVQALGLNFTCVFASFCPIEKTLSLYDPSIGSPLTEADKRLFEILYLTPYDYLEVSKSIGKKFECARHTNQVVLNYLGEAQLCCIVYDETKYGVGNFLDLSKEQLLNRRQNQSICKTCCTVNANERSYTDAELQALLQNIQRLQKERFKDYYSQNQGLNELIFSDWQADSQPQPVASDGLVLALEASLAAKDEQIKELRRLLEEKVER